jgi:transglutaminase-like putative cysteine protease
MGNGRRRYLRIALGSMLGSVVGTCLSNEQSAGVVRHLRLTISLVNPFSVELFDQSLWLYVPAGNTATQELRGLHVSVEHEILVDTLDHRVLKLSFARFAPLSTKIVAITADVMLHPTTVSALADPQSWLKSEKYIEVDEPAIAALAASLKRETTVDTGRAIFDWLVEHIRYAGYVADDLGALAALESRRADCTEYAYLAVALARANGVPARMIGGYLADRDMVIKSADYHNWAEIYLDGAWRLLDAQKGNWLAPADRYVAFRIYRDEAINPIGLAHRYRVGGKLQVSY